MKCKNCKTKLQENDLFCSNCGGKIVTKRLTFSSLMEELFSTIFSWDNKYFKTLLHLFTQPEVIIKGYINGVRKRYVKPISFLLISLTVYGLYMYFIKDSFNAAIDAVKNITQSTSESEKEFQETYNKFFKNILIKHSSLVTSLMIPLFALVTSIVFRKRNLNYIEHNLMFIYIVALTVLANVIVGSICLLFSVDFTSIMTVNSFFTFGFQGYVIIRVFQLNWKQAISKLLLSTLLGIAFYLLFIILIVILFFVYIKFFK